MKQQQREMGTDRICWRFFKSCTLYCTVYSKLDGGIEKVSNVVENFSFLGEGEHYKFITTPLEEKLDIFKFLNCTEINKGSSGRSFSPVTKMGKL